MQRETIVPNQELELSSSMTKSNKKASATSLGLINEQDSSTLSSEAFELKSHYSITISTPSTRNSAKPKPSREFNCGDLNTIPFLQDSDLSDAPVNYFLYLGFFHMGIRIFFVLLAFSIFCNVGYIIAAKYYPSLYSEDTLVFMYALFILCAAFLLRFTRGREEKKLMNHPALLSLPWTQDLFSLLVEGLPTNVTKREVAVYFNKILASKNVSGSVKNVLLLQDYYEHTQIKAEIKQLDIEYAGLKNKGPEREQDEIQILARKSQLVGLLGQLEAKIINLECFRGKAIVIFDTIQTREIINSHFSIFFLLQPFSRCFPKIDKKCYYKTNKLTITQPPEPQDLIFENLYYPRKNRVFFRILAYIASIFLTILFIFCLLIVNGLNFFSKPDFTSIEVADVLTSYGFVIGVLVLGFLLRIGYKFINSKLIHPSALASRVDTYNYSIYTSLLLYVPTQTIPIYFNIDLWTDQLMKVALLYFLERIVYKVFMNRWEEYKKEKNNKNTLQANLTENNSKDTENEFDFIDGVNSTIPLIFMAFTSLILDRFAILAIIVISLYILAAIDKYWLIKSQESIKLKSASYMLKAFRVFSWDSPCIVVAGLVMFFTYNRALVSDGPSLIGLNWYWLLGVFLLVLVLYVYLSKPLVTKIRETFFMENALKQYESVYGEFPFYYHSEDPWTRITT